MPGRCRGDLVGTTWKGLDCAEIPYQFKPWQIEAHNHMKSMAQTLYESRIHAYMEFQEIKSKIDIVFNELKKKVNLAHFKSKFKKVASKAGTVGL